MITSLMSFLSLFTSILILIMAYCLCEYVKHLISEFFFVQSYLLRQDGVLGAGYDGTLVVSLG